MLVKLLNPMLKLHSNRYAVVADRPYIMYKNIDLVVLTSTITSYSLKYTRLDII
jgi:hypothetical protein